MKLLSVTQYPSPARLSPLILSPIKKGEVKHLNPSDINHKMYLINQDKKGQNSTFFLDKESNNNNNQQQQFNSNAQDNGKNERSQEETFGKVTFPVVMHDQDISKTSLSNFSQQKPEPFKNKVQHHDFSVDYLYNSEKTTIQQQPVNTYSNIQPQQVVNKIDDSAPNSQENSDEKGMFRKQFTHKYNQHKNNKELQRLLDVSTNGVNNVSKISNNLNNSNYNSSIINHNNNQHLLNISDYMNDPQNSYNSKNLNIDTYQRSNERQLKVPLLFRQSQDVIKNSPKFKEISSKKLSQDIAAEKLLSPNVQKVDIHPFENKKESHRNINSKQSSQTDNLVVKNDLSQFQSSPQPQIQVKLPSSTQLEKVKEKKPSGANFMTRSRDSYHQSQDEKLKQINNLTKQHNSITNSPFQNDRSACRTQLKSRKTKLPIAYMKQKQYTKMLSQKEDQSLDKTLSAIMSSENGQNTNETKTNEAPYSIQFHSPVIQKYQSSNMNKQDKSIRSSTHVSNSNFQTENVEKITNSSYLNIGQSTNRIPSNLQRRNLKTSNQQKRKPSGGVIVQQKDFNFPIAPQPQAPQQHQFIPSVQYTTMYKKQNVKRRLISHYSVSRSSNYNNKMLFTKFQKQILQSGEFQPSAAINTQMRESILQNRDLSLASHRSKERNLSHNNQQIAYGMGGNQQQQHQSILSDFSIMEPKNAYASNHIY